ncbi:MAG: hypothetical protein EOM37_11350 [Proteobacteria bacterium]|nr:hypothetical protein [Pseudomonadota bacterium]
MKEGDYYYIFKNSKKINTPMGQIVKTKFQSLADKLVNDLITFGESPTDPVSIVAFHFAMIDFFSTMPRAELEQSVAVGLDRENDWTFNCPSAEPEFKMKWMGIFGTSTSNAKNGRDWLSSLSLIQLCAVCVTGRALESVNIPFIITNYISHDNIKVFAREIVERYPFIKIEELIKIIENYMFYFSLEKNL